MDKSNFKFSTQIRVRNYEVDWQGIVHNANYLLYFEVGRVEYLKQLGIKVDLNSIRHDSRIVLARNEVDYKSPAVFDELLTVHTRVASIRNTSFIFEGMIEETATGRRVAENVSVHVWLEPRTSEPIEVNDHFRRVVRSFEGGKVDILGKTRLT